MSSSNKGLGVVALVVAVIALLFSVFHSDSPAPTAGYTQSNVGQFPEGAQIGDVGVRNYDYSLGTGVAQTSYHNTSGRTQYVDLVVARTSGTASSTLTVTAGTSTSATFNGFSVAAGVKSFMNYTLATSTGKTTVTSNGGVGELATNGGGVAALADGEYLNIGIYQTYGTACTGSLCETATSTNRGFNVSGFIRVLQP